MRLISGTLRSTPLPWLPVLSNIEPPALRRKAATDKLVRKSSNMTDGQSSLIPLTHHCYDWHGSRKPLWLDLQPVDIKSRWRHNWKSAQGGQFSPSVQPHNPATGFWPPSATVISCTDRPENLHDDTHLSRRGFLLFCEQYPQWIPKIQNSLSSFLVTGISMTVAPIGVKVYTMV